MSAHNPATVLREGLLVDLVPMGDRFDALEHRWENGPAAFWGDMGARHWMTQAQVKRNQAERREQGCPFSGIAWGIQAKDGTPLGGFYVGFVLPHCRTAMLGLQIGEPDYWGSGYGTDALLLGVDHAFDWLDLRRLWLMTMALNARVLRQMEKVGFVPEARRRQATLADGAWIDVVLYGILREEWPGRAALVERLNLTERTAAAVPANNSGAKG